jgi:hypothetical protein
LIEYLSSYKGIFPSQIYNDILIPPPKLIAWYLADVNKNANSMS